MARSNADYLGEMGYDRYKPEPSYEEEMYAQEHGLDVDGREDGMDFSDPAYLAGQEAADFSSSLQDDMRTWAQGFGLAPAGSGTGQHGTSGASRLEAVTK